jgi:glutathione S-transferase
MLTLFHAPQSRSTSVLQLIDELGALDRVTVRTVSIHRLVSNSGAPDPANPHPEGKVPLLIHDGTMIRERNAIMLYLTELFPDAGLGIPPGHPQRGAILSWLAYYGNVMEPVFLGLFAGIDSPAYHSVFRGPAEVTAALQTALAKGPWLAGDRYTAADLLISGVYAWAPAMIPDHPLVKDWIARCQARPSVARTLARDAALMAA